MMMMKISENRNLFPIFEDILSTESSEIYLNLVENYVKIGSEVGFYTVSVLAI